MLYSMTDLLFRTKTQTIRLINKETGMMGAEGIYSKNRPSEKVNRSKYSSISLILDNIFLDKCILDVKGNQDMIFVRFSFDDTIYEATCNGYKVNWLEVAPESYMILLPFVVFAISEINSNKKAQLELTLCYQDIASNKNLNESILLFCDTFYYGMLTPDNHIESNEYSMDNSVVLRPIKLS
ncbi:hypothetical protein [Intestinibacter bartlettii]|jgi:hypothetical protein|uniref:hypothetical protein n=1 Tax=Intestinibacter bartlettii TaxID=261299 RepID=UPI0039A095F7